MLCCMMAWLACTIDTECWGNSTLNTENSEGTKCGACEDGGLEDAIYIGAQPSRTALLAMNAFEPK